MFESKKMKKFYLSLIIATATFQINAQTPAAYYPFDGNINDHSGNNHIAYMFNNAQQVYGIDRHGNPNSCIYLDGNSYVYSPNFSVGNFSSITYSAWIKTTNNSKMALYEWPGHSSFIGAFTLERLFAQFDGTSGNNTIADEATTYICDGNWHYITCINDGDATKLYVDGVLESAFSEILYHPNPTKSLHIGGHKYPTVPYFIGWIDEFKVFNYALSETEIQNEFNPSSNISFDQIDDLFMVNILPNKINIYNTSGKGNFDITLFNLNGQQIFHSEKCFHKVQINHSISNSLVILRIRVSDNVQTRKFFLAN